MTTIETQSLGPDSTTCLRKGIITPEAVEAIEKQTGAYFDFDRSEYGGLFVSFQPNDQNPIRLLHQAKEEEALPEIQAIAQIGGQFYYWQALRNVVIKPDFGSSRPMAMFLIPAYFDENDVILEINRADYSTDCRIQYLAKRRGHVPPQYDALIRTFNLGGDLDFWGIHKNSLLEIKIKNADGGNAYISSKLLGLTDELLDMTWKSRKDTSSAFESLYTSVLKSLLKSEQILQEIAVLKVLGNKIIIGEVRSSGDLNVALVKAGITDEETILIIAEIMNHQIKERLIEEGDNNPFLRSLDLLVQHLRQMYDEARIYCHDRGFYPFNPNITEEFIIYPV